LAALHLIKLSVGSDSIESLTRWQDGQRARAADGLPRHVTRMWPRRADEVCAGGSVYWVVAGFVQCRQRLLRFEEVTGQDGVRRCAFVLDPEIVRTTTARRKPFQGWRYLKPEDAPADLPATRHDDDALPAELSAALSEIGVI
jgi:hypothetical protein